MKRVRALALEDTVVEIIKESNARYENDTFVYPFMYESFGIVIFGAADALLEILKERPNLAGC